MNSSWWLTEQVIYLIGFFSAVYYCRLLAIGLIESARVRWIFGGIVLAVVGFFVYQTYTVEDDPSIPSGYTLVYPSNSQDLESYLKMKPTLEKNHSALAIDHPFRELRQDIVELGEVVLLFGIPLALAVALLKYRDWNRSRIHLPRV